ncbi:hypothetical protein BQ8794_240109 [Mesorhizobium prunaredense]|uniref:Uncharacterized protein n=1 Tax=Mesorhizobium prunaredense TaxID=1631249 RepID=A0A1R3V7N5_9HYPH|nr:hypothetical protein BQ8794_240109 [Mesorhizobium prunaredense]
MTLQAHLPPASISSDTGYSRECRSNSRRQLSGEVIGDRSCVPLMQVLAGSPLSGLAIAPPWAAAAVRWIRKAKVGSDAEAGGLSELSSLTMSDWDRRGRSIT